MNQAQFQSRVTEALMPHTAALTDVLRRLVVYEYPPEVAELAFEVFPDGFTSGFPVRVFFVDSDNCEFFMDQDGELKYPAPVDPGLLELPRVYGRELEAELERSDPDADSMTLAGNTLIAWFERCWQAAGGTGFSRVATIQLHDDQASFDLVSQRWVGA